MMLTLAEKHAWIDTNILDDILNHYLYAIDSSLFIKLMLAPMREVLGLFLYLEDEKQFSPMHEF